MKPNRQVRLIKLLFLFVAQSLIVSGLLSQNINKSAVNDALQNMPATFRANIGQWDDAILYRGGSPGWNANINFLKSGLSFGFSRASEKNIPGVKDEYERFVWNLNFKNANSAVEVSAEGQQESHNNYLVGDPSRYRTNVPDYKLLRYKNLYNNIDLKYYSTGQNLEYDYIIHPYGNIADIALGADGIEKLSVNRKNELEIKTAWGTLIEKIPESYQLVNGKKTPVKVSYLILNDKTYSFHIDSEYDPSADLVIDPVTLVWATYIGSNGSTSNRSYLSSITADKSGCVYATGWYDGSFPITTGAYGGGSCDAFVFKLSANASTLLYCTYLGGNDYDGGYSIKINPAGEAYVCGYTSSSDFIGTSTVGNYDAFVVHLNAAGTAALYSKRIGGSGGDYGCALDLNASGEAFVIGCTTSTDFPVTANATYSTKKAGADWFVARLNSTGTTLLYGSYIGGSAADGNKYDTYGTCTSGAGIIADAAGIAYLTGFTASTDFPTTAGAYQTAPVAGAPIVSGIAAKINTNTGTLMYSTYISNAAGIEIPMDLAVNAAGDMFIAGVEGQTSTTTNFPFLTPYLKATYPYFNDDAFVMRINPAGGGASDLVYKTVFGGAQLDEAFGIALTGCDEAFVAGRTLSTDFPVTSCATQAVNADGGTKFDQFLVKFDASGNQVYGSFMGGSNWDYWGCKMFIAGNGRKVYYGGTTHSTDFPTTTGVYQKNNLNPYAFDQPEVHMFKADVAASIANTAAACNTPINFTGSVAAATCIWNSGAWTPSSWSWDFGDGTKSTVQNPSHTYLAGGSYTVTLIVSCPNDTVKKTITLPNGSLTLTPSSTGITCPNPGTASIAASGGAGTYTYQWSPGGQTTSSISVLVPGVYTVAVSDGVSCGNTKTVTVNLSSALPLTITSTTTAPSTCSSTDGQISVSASGGSGTYTYSWSNGVTTSNNSNISSGSYTVTVSDATCYQSTKVINLSSSGVTVVASPTAMSGACSGGNSGSAQAGVPSGGTSPYMYTWSNGLVGNNSTAFFNNNLAAGTYTLTVTDANGCAGISTVVIGGAVSVSATSTPSGCGGSVGTATATASGGVGPPYYYTWSAGFQTSASISSLAPGTYTVSVGDGYCYTSTTVTVGSSGGTISLATSSTPSNCGTASGTAYANPSGGSGAYTYSWNNTASAQTATALLPATYTVTVKDASGCSATSAVVVTQTSAAFTLATSETPASCAGSDGTATVTPNPAGTYTYSWNNTQTTQTATALNAATYTVTVKDGGGCTVTGTIAVTQSGTTFTLSTSSTASSCSASDGTATVTPSPSGTYTYSWSNTQTSQTATALGAATYTVTVKDGGGCSSTSTVAVTQSGLTFTLATSSTPSSCAGSDGTATVTPNPSGTYTYSWSNTQTTQTATALNAATYTVTVKDAGGCSSTSTVAVTQSGVIFTITTSSTPSSCAGSDGTATVTPNPSGTYTYSWSNTQTTQTVTALSAATYTVTVKDAGGCSSTSTVAVTQSGITFTLATSSTPSSCAGSDGTATVTPNPSGTYTYSWSNTETTQTATALSAATYTVTVKDAGGCSSTSTVAVTQSGITFTLATSSTPSSCAGSDGTATVTPNPSGTYTYSWSNTQTTQTATALSAATYTVTVKDAGGCSSTSTVAVTSGGTGFTLTMTSTPAGCTTGGTATATGSVVDTYSYAWSPGSQTTQTATNLSAGVYTVTVTNAATCTATSTVTVGSSGTAVTASTSSVNSTCGGSNGSASVSVSTGTAPYTYVWSSGGTAGTTLSGILAGTYTVTIIDAGSCSATQTVVVSNSSTLVVTATATAACEVPGGSIVATASGGTSPYSYSWSPSGGTAATAVNLSSGTYSVYVKDAALCSVSTAVTLTNNPMPVASAGSDTTVTFGTSVVLNASGGTSYTWTPSSYLSCTVCPDPTSKPPTTTSYTLLVSDANGCAATDSMTVFVDEKCNGTSYYLPNAFSPNGDGYNDVFRVRSYCIKTFLLDVFNRWGQKVFETSDANLGWDGKFNGVDCDSGVYIYYLKIEMNSGDQVAKKGNITLLR